MKHPRFYKGLCLRNQEHPPALGRHPLPPCKQRVGAFHIVPLYFSDGLLCGGQHAPPYPAAKPQKSRPIRAADVWLNGGGGGASAAVCAGRGAGRVFSAHAAGGLWRRAACLRRGGRRAGRSPCGAARANAAAAIRAARLFCFMVPTPSVVGGKGRMIRAGGVLFRKAG